MTPSPDHKAALLELNALCDHALENSDLWPRLAGSLMLATSQLRRPAGNTIDEFLVTVAAGAETARHRIWTTNITPGDELAQFAAERAIRDLQQLMLTALGVMEGDVVLLRH
jgi:hypothetical protein